MTQEKKLRFLTVLFWMLLFLINFGHAAGWSGVYSLLIKEIYNAQAIPSPARVKAIIFCIVAIIKKQNNNEVSNISYFVIK